MDGTGGTLRRETSTVAIVDDDQTTNRILEHTLRRAGFQTCSAFSVAEAREMIQRVKPDLVLLDVGLPDGSGFDVCAEFGSKLGEFAVPILFISAHDDVSTKVKALEAGAVDFLTKPIVPSEAVARVHTHLRIREAARVLEKMHERDQTLQAMADAALDAVLMMDSKGRITFYNRAAEKIFGWSATEVLGADLHRLLMPDRYLTAYERGIRTFHRDGQGPIVGSTREVMARAKDGRELPIEISVSAVKLGDGWNAVGIVRDISERKKSEMALRESEEQHRALFENSQDAILVIEPSHWSISAANPACAEMFQIRDFANIGLLKLWDLSPHCQPDGQASDKKLLALLDSAMQDGSASFEWQHRRLDGEEFPAAVRLTRIFRKEKKFILATVRDIASQKQAEAALRASEEKFRQIVSNIGLGVALVDTSMRVVEMNKKLREWFADMALGQTPPYHAAFRASDKRPSGIQPPAALTIRNGKVCEATATIDNRHYRIVSSPIHDTEGGVSAAIEVVEDITDRLRMEQDLRQAQKLESVGLLAAGIAHEINTPTQYIGDNIEFLQGAYESLAKLTELLRQIVVLEEGSTPATEIVSEAKQLIEESDLDFLSEQIPKALEQSIDGVGRIASIVLAMKQFSHPGSSEKTLTDLNQCIQSTVTVSRNEWKYVADLETDLDPALPSVLCLPAELNQVFLNLIVNASHAIKDVVQKDNSKGRIRITSRHDGDCVEIRIADSGTGIPVEIRDRVFDPFFTTKEVGRGTGQGLAIARSAVVDKHGGTITFESEVGKGTTFIVRIPIGN